MRAWEEGAETCELECRHADTAAQAKSKTTLLVRCAKPPAVCGQVRYSCALRPGAEGAPVEATLLAGAWKHEPAETLAKATATALRALRATGAPNVTSDSALATDDRGRLAFAPAYKQQAQHLWHLLDGVHMAGR